MIFGHTPEHEIFRAIPVRRAEFPERIANRVEPGRSHVYRAESAVCRPIRRAVLLRPQSRERLHLVASGEKRELFWIRRADVCEPFGQQIQRVVPRNRIENAVAAFGAGAANHRVLQLRFRILLHDARAALGAQHALVHDVIFVALNEANVPLTRLARFAWTRFRRDLDAAAAGAHVAGGVMRLLLATILELNGPFRCGRERRFGGDLAWRQREGTDMRATPRLAQSFCRSHTYELCRNLYGRYRVFRNKRTSRKISSAIASNSFLREMTARRSSEQSNGIYRH